ncbi:MAG: protein-glutamate O-methyltransferase CheR [Planctomycetales bacterium]|nr:protein-glutamate O-methyltransferase CheR [bacterium]UNM07298.1 MAG: protein-glutamate O-methyltransferase CheR [Planctomycetales bacterium]
MVKYTDLDSESNLSAEADYIHSKDDYIKFLDTLYSVEGIDLSLYKQNQLRRRLNHIVRKTPCKTYVEYLTQIRKDEEEYRSFIDRITINVSNFFRNAEKFDILERDYLKPLIKTRREATLWSAGCSTGDEPYTLAIMLEENNAPSGFKVLGWDFDKNALAKAREGIYPAERLKESPKGVVEKYFDKLPDGNYQVKQFVRNRVRFEQHNLLEDRFPSNMDIILCRNVVIYFRDQAKRELFIRFSKALARHGVLMIGGSERIPNTEEAGLISLKTYFYGRSDRE